jgi:hypothetical protein
MSRPRDGAARPNGPEHPFSDGPVNLTDAARGLTQLLEAKRGKRAKLIRILWWP